MSKKNILTRGLAAVALVSVLGGAIVEFAPKTLTSTAALAAGLGDEPARAATAAPAMGGPDFSPIVERFGPAVVNIRVEGTARAASDDTPMFPGMPPDFARRFGLERPDRPVRGLGSGFIVASDGLILTNAHVVKNARTVTVKLSDQREFAAKVIGLDQATDVAVLKINAKDLPTVTIGDADKVHVGEWVLAIGSPYGFENTVTAGIVSATSRALPNQSYVPFIQTDVPVNPGNSGGPLFNTRGEVVGINSQIYSDTGGYQGLSFAIPISVAMKVQKQIVAHGTVHRGWLGATVQDVTQALADAFGLAKPGGVLVSSVEQDSPAAKAGLQSGDVILKLNGSEVPRSGDLPPRIADLAPGTRAHLDIWRRGEAKQLAVTIGERHADQQAQADSSTPATQGRLGLAVRPLSPQEARSIDEKGGLLVEGVTGPAARAGVQPGDVVLSFNGQPVTSIDALRGLAAKAQDHAALLIRRENAKIFVPLDLG
ncbi:DegQ family serine endoprotease [Vineibacter terrae]|uniref:Probable periplasmic serine endoprotease DegP-like n=1 Tax=Vineibacter terrae TaxID=2586908 RepID=A0A5C8PHT2_9HYPH|nr:DegQ family serine endoprotease [Vineibacter terrae]TXL73027.1 DegQ family serine endoprotease [Vineibacter terrae]